MEKENLSPARGAVQLVRRKLVKDYVDALTPQNVTNSGKSDGGWMDSMGVTAAGLGHMLTETPDPIDMFISNNAYARAGFATMQIELYPPLEVTGGKPTTRENLLDFLKNNVSERENNYYKMGNYDVRDSPHINHPKQLPGGTTNADIIVQYWYSRQCDVSGHDIPLGLRSVEQFAALHFSGRGIVFFKAANFEGHNRNIDFMEILSSIRFIKNTPYLGFRNTLAIALRNQGHMAMQEGKVDAHSTGEKVPKLCLQCGASDQTKTDMKQCGRCKVAYYCSLECQQGDWKRHKKGECLPREVSSP